MNDKYELLSRSLNYIKEDTINEWSQFGNNTTNIAFLEQIVQGLRLLQEGETCEMVGKKCIIMGATGFIGSIVFDALTYFSPRGDEFREHLINKHYRDKETKETKERMAQYIKEAWKGL